MAEAVPLGCGLGVHLVEVVVYGQGLNTFDGVVESGAV